MAIYLDHNATTPLDKRVLEAMLPYLERHYGNPSSLHRFGRLARSAIESAREQVATLVGAHPSQVVFTSGGTESNALALLGAGRAMGAGEVAVSAIEHASVRSVAGSLQREGWRLRTLGVDAAGIVDMATLKQALREGAGLVSVMWANNETGVMQDMATIADLVREHGALLHSDAVQAVGKVEVDMGRAGVPMLSLSAHKLYGPKGVGALLLDKGIDLLPPMPGGGQERGLRGGSENVAGIVGFGRAAELARLELASRGEHLRGLRDALVERLVELPGVRLYTGVPETGPAEEPSATRRSRGEEPSATRRCGIEYLPNTVMFAVPGTDGETLLMQLDRKGLAVASGSACSSTSNEPNPVLLAMGVAADLARGAVRVSFGKDNSGADVDRLVGALTELNQHNDAAASWL